MVGNTQYEKEGNAPIITETFDALVVYEYTSSDTQLGNLTGLRFLLLADPANAANVLIGGSSGAKTFPMEAGFGLTLEVENLNQIFVTITGSDKLHALVYNEA